MRAVSLLVLTGCYTGTPAVPPAPLPTPPSPVENLFLVGEEGRAEDLAVAPNGDLLIVGCEPGATFVRRFTPSTQKIVWTRRSASPCGHGDNWTVPRVAVSDAGTIWVAAYGWGRGGTGEKAAMFVLAFDAAGTLGVERELPEGLRVRAMVGLAGDGVAIAGQSATIHDRPTAFIAALHPDATERWRRELGGPYLGFIDTLARDGEQLLVGGHTDSTIEDDGPGGTRGRESDAFVHRLAPNGAVQSSHVFHHAGVNVSNLHVAVAGGRAFVAMELGLRRGMPWPHTLPPRPADALDTVLVQPLGPHPAWRELLSGSTYSSLEGFAATGDRLALVLDFQHGDIDLGAGEWHAELFNLGAFVALSTSTGGRLEARKLETRGRHQKVFFRSLIWDGGAFSAVGVKEDKTFLWRFGSAVLRSDDA